MCISLLTPTRLVFLQKKKKSPHVTRRSLHELNEQAWLYEFVKQAIVKVLEKHDRERELVSVLLSSLYASVLPERQIEKGFRFVCVYLLRSFGWIHYSLDSCSIAWPTCNSTLLLQWNWCVTPQLLVAQVHPSH